MCNEVKKLEDIWLIWKEGYEECKMEGDEIGMIMCVRRLNEVEEKLKELNK